MELRIIARGALAGLLAGILGFVFARVFTEPLIAAAIDYESGRDDVLAQLNGADGHMHGMDGHELVSRALQSSAGLATGVIGFAVAMGALVAVGYVALHGRVALRPRHLVWAVTAFGFAGIYLLPFAKYPANPPAVGHDFTIRTRGELYLAMVVASVVLLGAAVVSFARLRRRFSAAGAGAIAVAGFLVLYGVLLAALPSVGELSDNVAASGQFGYARAATETPQPITNISAETRTVDGRSYAPGQVVYPGFDADVLWKFRWYSLLGQVLVWSTIAVTLGWAVDRLTGGRRSVGNPSPADPVPASR